MHAPRPACLAAVLLLAALPLGTSETVLVQMASPMRYHVPASSELGLTWTERVFPETGWVDGTYGVGYDTQALPGMIRTTVPDFSHCVYTRARFTIDDLASVESVWLGADYDDGYVAWINGARVDEKNMPGGDPAFDTNASGGHESSNGSTPTLDPLQDITAKAKPALVQGENVLAIGVWNNSDPQSTDLGLVPFLSLNRLVTPPGEVRWTLADSPKQVTSTLTIPRGTLLRIDPGVQVQLGAGVKIVVAGQIFAEGTAESPIRFDRIGTGGYWGGIEIDHASDGAIRSSAIRFAEIVHISTAIDVDGTGESEILIEDCAIDSWSSLAFHWDNGANRLHIDRCRCGMNTPQSEWGHEAVNGYRSSALLERCTFGPRSGYNDTIDLGNAKWGGPVPTIQYNEIHAGNDDGIDFDNCDGYIIGNFIHGRRPPANFSKDPECPQYPVAGSGANGGGITGNEGSRPFVMNNIIFDCFHGIGYKNGARPTLISNTIVGCTWGIVLFETSDVPNPDLAHGVLVNNVIWDCKDFLGVLAAPIRLRWCDSGPLSTVEVSYSLVPGGWEGPGNISPAESPFATAASPASPSREQFRLGTCSSAIDAGFAGQVAQTFHVEDVPATDSEGNARADMATVADTGAGSPSFYDLGALEYQGPDDCGPQGSFIRGDSNGDGEVDISDVVKILFFLFASYGTDCKDALDVNDDEDLNLTDPVALLDFLFRSGSVPADPFEVPGPDPTTEGNLLGCARM